jgi:hemoglobin-like flavoprotein
VNDSQVLAVQDSFVQFVMRPVESAELFYGRLFEIAPEVKPLFVRVDDMNKQGRDLMATLRFIVRNLNNPDELLPVSEALAERHVGYGVLPEHYAHVGAALFYALGHSLGDEFTPEVEEAWRVAYGGLTAAMIASAYASED